MDIEDVFEKSYRVLVYLRYKTKVPVYGLIEVSTEEELRTAIEAC